MRTVQPNIQPFLDCLISHSRLNATEQEAVRELPQRVLHVDANEVFVPLNRAADQITVVTDGVIGRFSLNEDGGRQIIALAIRGDAPDLHTIVLPSVTAPLLSLTKSTVVRVSHSALRTISERHPAIAEAFWRHCSIDASIMATWVVNVGHCAARKRICHLLCEMAVRLKANQEGPVRFSFPITQANLADALGITSVHVNRTLKGLEADGVVDISGRVARIPDWRKLVEQAKFDGDYLATNYQPAERLRLVG